jgi:hypothetical protein
MPEAQQRVVYVPLDNTLLLLLHLVWVGDNNDSTAARAIRGLADPDVLGEGSTAVNGLPIRLQD